MNINKDQELVCGINTVKEIISIRPNSVEKLLLQDNKESKRIELVSLDKCASFLQVRLV